MILVDSPSVIRNELGSWFGQESLQLAWAELAEAHGELRRMEGSLQQPAPESRGARSTGYDPPAGTETSDPAVRVAAARVLASRQGRELAKSR